MMQEEQQQKILDPCLGNLLVPDLDDHPWE